MAMSLACLWLLPLSNLTPSTSKQWGSVAFVLSRSLPLCAAISNFVCIVATPRFVFVLHGVTQSSVLLFSTSSRTSSTMWIPTSLQGCGSTQKHAWQTKHVLREMQTYRLHVAHPMPVRKSKEVMVASICVKGSICYKNYEHIYFVTFPTLSRRCVVGQRCLRPLTPPKKGSMSPSSATATWRCRY